MISDADIEKALDYMRDNATAAARARAEREYVTEFRKTIKAEIMKENVSESIGAQEREAYADQRYKSHLEAIKEAVYQDEYRRFMMEAAKTKISCWQTECSNKRAERV